MSTLQGRAHRGIVERQDQWYFFSTRERENSTSSST